MKTVFASIFKVKPLRLAGLGLLLVSLVSTVSAESFREIGWDDLIPAEWRVESLFEGMDLSEMSDDDPRVDEVMSKLDELASKAPIEPKIDGENIRIPGYMVPVETGTDEVFEFLLVPYYGACIHVPPPPINQTVFVKTPKGKPYKGDLFDTVWVNGKITVERSENDIGNAGYLIQAEKVEKYE